MASIRRQSRISVMTDPAAPGLVFFSMVFLRWAACISQYRTPTLLPFTCSTEACVQSDIQVRKTCQPASSNCRACRLMLGYSVSFTLLVTVFEPLTAKHGHRYLCYKSTHHTQIMRQEDALLTESFRPLVNVKNLIKVYCQAMCNISACTYIFSLLRVIIFFD